MNRLAWILLAVSISVPVSAQLPSADEWRADVAVLREALENLHPGLHRYRTAAELNAGFARLERDLTAARSLGDAYVALARFTSTIECGHTFPNPANQSDAVADSIFRKTPRVPFYFRWLEGRMIVTGDASASRAFAPGMEIRAINGIAAGRIREKLLPLARTDGANRGKRLANLDVLPENRWEAFDVLYPLVFAPPASDAWTFDVRMPDGTARAIASPPTTDEARLAVRDEMRRASKAANAPPWTLTVDGRRAVLTMKTWVTFNDQWDWEGYLRDAFASIRSAGVLELVIDLRGNEGGSAVGEVILAHLTTRELPRESFGRYVRYQKIPATLRPMLETWDRSFDDWSATTRPSAARKGFYEVIDESPAAAKIAPRAPHFAGRVAVLTGPANSSATFRFALAVRNHGIATLVGQPTGGNRRGTNGGAFYFLRLPYSRLEVDLPLIGYYPTTPQRNEGISPDVLVKPTPRSIAAGDDVELARAFAVIARR